MTLRKLWLIVLVSVTIITIAVNTAILAFLTNRYFSDYLSETYDLHVNQILEYVASSLSSDDISYDQMEMELESHLTDPIIEIKLYSPDGEILAEVANESGWSGGSMMGNRRMGQMMGSTDAEEVHSYDIKSSGQIMGVIHITTTGLAENSFVAQRFQVSLIRNSLFSFAVAIMMSIVIAIFVSRKMSKSLKETEKLANDIQIGQDVVYKSSGIKEVNSIRASLMELNTRLKLRQKTRKSLVDQLVHQTRTPLSILKSHVEAMEDGIVEVGQEEFQVCENQIQNLTAIISNMSSMIDAGSSWEELNVENFDLGMTLRQMKQGLNAQFQKKKIQLQIDTEVKLVLHTDRYRLSQSVYNLLMNAYKYTDEGGKVTVSYHAVHHMVMIQICDTGIGIAKEEQEHIFEAYYRGHDHQKTGQGIGLYIVKENVTQMNGTISVTSEPGCGSTFTINIPQQMLVS